MKGSGETELLRYTVLIDGKTGAYGVVFPDIPGCVAMGRTVDEAISHAVDALRDWFELSEEHGFEVSPPRPLEKLRRDPDVSSALAEGATLATVPLIRETGKPVKANLSLDAGILAAIDAAAEHHKLTRSAMVELLAKTTLPRIS